MNKSTFLQKTLVLAHRLFLGVFYIILRATIGLYCRLRFRPQYERPKEVRRLKTPYVVLADHVHPMDMFMNGLGIRPVIRWAAADATFRTPFMRFAMTVLAGAVAKAKNRSDMVTLGKLMLLAEMGCVIGIYQEGECNWDGVSLPPIKGTDKLIRFLKIPVVYAHLEGAYLEHPRWTWSGNRTKIKVRYELLIGRDEIRTMSLAEINRRITEAGTYDVWEHQRNAANILKGEKRAENVELVCFLCPGCRSVGTLSSSGNDFGCDNCGTSGSINNLGRFEWSEPPRNWPEGLGPFDNVRDWNLWQTDYYRKLLCTLRYNPGSGGTDPAEVLLWEDKDCVDLGRGKRASKMKELGIGTARLFGDRIEFDIESETLIMSLSEVSSFSVFKQHNAEFYYERHLLRFTGTNRSVSGYKWLLLLQLITEAQADARSAYHGQG